MHHHVLVTDFSSDKSFRPTGRRSSIERLNMAVRNLIARNWKYQKVPSRCQSPLLAPQAVEKRRAYVPAYAPASYMKTTSSPKIREANNIL